MSATPRDQVFWRGFLRTLKERGLAGVRLAISDHYASPVAALRRPSRARGITNLGRLAKGWTGDVDGVEHRLVFRHRASGCYTGRLSARLDSDGLPVAIGFTVRDGRRVAIAWAWEPLIEVKFNDTPACRSPGRKLRRAGPDG